MKRFRDILLLLVAVMISSVALEAKKAPDAKADDASMRKARYYYLEAAKRQAEDDPANAYELFKHALRIRPDYSEAAMQVAQIRVMLRHDSLRSRAEAKKSLRMMQDYVDTYPGDFFESQYYGYIATQLDTLAEARRIYARADSLYPERTMTLLKLAEISMMMRDREGTFDALEKYQAREGRSDYLTRIKVLYNMVFADTVKALEEATINVAENPQSTAAQLLLGKVYEMMNEKDSARVYYQKAEALNPDDGGVKFEIARFYLSNGDTATYEQKIYEGLLSEDIEAPQKIGMLGDFVKSMNVHSADTLKVDRLFDVMTQQYPHEASLRELSAAYNFQRNKMDRALEDIDYAIDLDPEDEQLYAQKLMIEAYNDKYADALVTFHRAEQVFEPSWKLMELAGQSASLLPDSAEAYRIYDKMLKLIDPALNATDTAVNQQVIRRFDSETADAVSHIFTSLGDMLHNLGDKSGSYKKYQVAVDTYPLNSLALNNYAYFLAVDGGDLEKALNLSEESLEIQPESVTFLDTFAFILFKLGKPAEALDYQLQAVDALNEDDTSSAELFDHLGDIYFALGEKDKALENWKKALKLEPESKLIKRKIDKKQYFEE